MSEKSRLHVALMVVALFLGSTSAVAEDRVSIRSEKKKDPAGARYSYTVTNRSPKEIVTVLIGEDLDKGVPHLRSNPLGWSFKESEQVGYGWTIPRRAAAAPEGWIPLLVLFEESNEVALSWIVKDDTVPGIAAGDTLAGFEVTVAKEDPSFLNPPFTIIFADGTSFAGTVKAE